jgi:hypothetical protein
VAAGLSLVNVGLTARLASRGQREQWRRDEERPIVARCITLSRDAVREWWFASVANHEKDEDGRRSHWEKGVHLVSGLNFEIAQLELLASSAVRQVAHDLADAHTRESARVPREVLGENGLEATRAAQAKINELETALVEATRADLGLGLAKPPKSLLGMLIAAINGP